VKGVVLEQKEADNEMRKKMIQVEGIVLEQIVQRKESNFVQAAIALDIVDRNVPPQTGVFTSCCARQRREKGKRGLERSFQRLTDRIHQ